VERENLIQQFSNPDDETSYRRITDHLNFGEDRFQNVSHLEIEVDDLNPTDETIEDGMIPTERTRLI